MRRAGFRLLLSGFLLAFLPVLIAAVGALLTGSSPFDESSGYGAALWLLLLTFPAGMVVGTIGFVLYLLGVARERPTSNSPST
jgi:hypothetical protein